MANKKYPILCVSTRTLMLLTFEKPPFTDLSILASGFAKRRVQVFELLLLDPRFFNLRKQHLNIKMTVARHHSTTEKPSSL